MNQLPEIILLDKPKGITSFGAISRLRRKFNIKKMGHAGTLDPLASGLLIVGAGKGTKKLNDYLKLDKVYEADILLGRKTTTADMEGQIVEQQEVSEIDLKKVKKVFKDLVGKIDLPVPFYSAIKVKGQRLYKMARKGQRAPNLPVKTMKIYKMKLLDHFKWEDGYVLRARMKVGSGAYVRSIAEEIGKRLGLPATVKELRRTRIGKFKVKNAMTLDLEA